MPQKWGQEPTATHAKGREYWAFWADFREERRVFCDEMVPDVGFKTKRRKKSSVAFSVVRQRFGVNVVFAGVKKPAVACGLDGSFKGYER